MAKLVVITGASSGIGKATAIRLSKMGHPLLMLARRVDKLTELNLPNTLCKQVDVTNLDSFRKAVAEAEVEFGPVDLLINNAGIMLLGNIDSQNESEWIQMINVNLIGVLNGIKTVVADMIKRQTGTIINISSTAGRKTYTEHAVYCATKFAVHGLSENIREEIAGTNVRMTIIAPGAVDTELLSHTTDEKIIADYREWVKTYMGHGLDPDDVARAIEYAYTQPQDVCIRELVLTATKQFK